MNDLREKPAGLIRITADQHSAESILWPALHRFLPGYPDIKVEVTIDYGLSDIVTERYDAGVRLGGDRRQRYDRSADRAPRPGWSWLGRRYILPGRAKPKVPQDLTSHLCINFLG